jgi:hypothetical protein
MILSNNILVEKCFYFLWFQQFCPYQVEGAVFSGFILDNSVCLFCTAVANMSVNPCNQQVNFFLFASAEGSFV